MPADRSKRRYAGGVDCRCRVCYIELYSDTLGMPEPGCFDFKKARIGRFIFLKKASVYEDRVEMQGPFIMQKTASFLVY
jgi:hypothetical protein